MEDALSNSVLGLAKPPPLSLYVHIPWCIRKCPYCDFNSHENRNGFDESLYIDALIADFEQSLPSIWGRKIHTIFFGGGTPSLFSAEAIARLLHRIKMLVPFAHQMEISLEANPGTVDLEHFVGYREAGVNRLSLGIQSFNDKHLSALGRIHDKQAALEAIKLATSHFDSVNLDVMYALPNQSLDEAIEDAITACKTGVSHLSFYHLTLEPNTPFYRSPPAIPDEDTSAQMQEDIERTLGTYGYEHYETSAFAKPGNPCRHNLNYWQFGDYLGIGAGAHSKLSFHDRIIRQSRHKHPNRYLAEVFNQAPIDHEHSIPLEELPFEFLMNALRLTKGFDIDLFQERTGLDFKVVAPKLDEAAQKGLLTIDQNAGHVQPTLMGQRFLNELLQGFIT
jgi:putative oxygen-independent coproporphyrinogen III oxidase